MTFLEICRRMASKAGIAGTTPLTTENQSGEALRVVNWCKDAYIDIQERRVDWSFMRQEFSFDCVPGVSAYPRSTVPNLQNWLENDIRCHLGTTDDEQWLCRMDWADFRTTRMMGPQRTVTGRPQDYTVRPDKSMVLWPLPDSPYTIGGEYYRTAAPFVLDTDIPVFDRFNMAVVYQALMYYGAYSSEPSVYADAQKEFERLIDKMEFEYTEHITLGIGQSQSGFP